MKSQTAYCSACDRDVQIVITDEPSQDGHANLMDAEIVCLEIGNKCTGELCPIGATSPTVMAARLVRNGLQTIMHPVIDAMCDRCGKVTPHAIIEPSHATCVDCGAAVARGNW